MIFCPGTCGHERSLTITGQCSGRKCGESCIWVPISVCLQRSHANFSSWSPYLTSEMILLGNVLVHVPIGGCDIGEPSFKLSLVLLILKILGQAFPSLKRDGEQGLKTQVRVRSLNSHKQ